MFLSLQDKNLLIGRLPELELSYDTIVHRKVYADVFVIIPKGKKALLWFTYWKGQNVCFTLTLNERGNICDISNQPVCFGSDLSLSTLLYGTLLEVDGIKHFTCENIYYYKGYYVGHTNFGEKLALFRELFVYYIRQVAYTTSFLVIGLPVMKTDFQEAISTELDYSTYGIQMFLKHKSGSEGIYIIKQSTLHEGLFLVKATLQSDVYHLYAGGAAQPLHLPKPPGCKMAGSGNEDRKVNGYTTFVGARIATIPSYKSSVMMNSLFRTIKENANLDLLEESDDDEEFENSSESKFVDLNKSIVMKCVYIKRFRKWQPIDVYKGKGQLITVKEVQMIEK